MKFTLIFVTLSTLALSNAKLPRPLKDCEDKVLSFECPDGQKPFPFLGEECSGISSGDDVPKRDLKGMNPCKGVVEGIPKKISNIFLNVSFGRVHEVHEISQFFNFFFIVAGFSRQLCRSQ